MGGLDTTVMVRSILLRGFDTQVAVKIGEYMEEHGVNFVRECVPEKLEKIEEEAPGMIKVTGRYKDGTEFADLFNTVIFAIGRDACTKNIGLEAAGVATNPKNGKVLHDEREATNVPNIFAIGDVLEDKPELTPVAIQAGKLLARRMCGVSDMLTDYVNVCTTVFTPLEYGCCGLSEEDAIAEHGEENIEVYHTNFWPLEWTVAHRPENACYCKLVCLKQDKVVTESSEGLFSYLIKPLLSAVINIIYSNPSPPQSTVLNEKVIGFHYLGPNAGEVTQGFGIAIKMGATKADFDNLIGIHPTTAENFTTLDITKSSGADASATGC